MMLTCFYSLSNNIKDRSFEIVPFDDPGITIHETSVTQALSD